MLGSAVFDPTGRYRYRLDRSWTGGAGSVTFVMLNPSTANATHDDPTVRRCIGFARDWGYARLVVVNLFAFRATSPAALFAAPDPVGPDNPVHLAEAFSSADLVVAAWGNHAARLPKPVLPCAPLVCLGRTQLGHPRHPLYVPGSAKLVHYQLPVPGV